MSAGQHTMIVSVLNASIELGSSHTILFDMDARPPTASGAPDVAGRIASTWQGSGHVQEEPDGKVGGGRVVGEKEGNGDAHDREDEWEQHPDFWRIWMSDFYQEVARQATRATRAEEARGMQGGAEGTSGLGQSEGGGGGRRGRGVIEDIPVYISNLPWRGDRLRHTR